jgi:hypothetical protein
MGRMEKPLDLPSAVLAFRGGWISIKTTREAIAFVDAVSKSPVSSLEWLRIRDAFCRAEQSGDVAELRRAYNVFQQQLTCQGWMRDRDALTLYSASPQHRRPILPVR